MENLTLEQIRDAVIVLVAVLAFVVLLGNFIKTVKGYDLEEGNRVICRGILAMLSHEINGNSKDKLISSQQEITNYLIER